MIWDKKGHIMRIISNPIFTIAVIVMIDIMLMLYSFSFIMSKETISTSKSYVIIARFFSSQGYGMTAFSIAVFNIIFLKTIVIRFYVPLTLGFLITVALAAYGSLGYVAPVSGVFAACSILLAVAYFAGGGFKIQPLDKSLTAMFDKEDFYEKIINAKENRG